MSNFSIRLARRGDTRPMAIMSRDLIETGLGWRWTPQRLEASLRDRATNGLVATEGERIIGFALMKYLDDEAHLLLLAVRPESRRAGVGRALLNWLETSALVAGIGSIELEVRVGSHAARVFYRQLGYQELGLVPGYYGGRETAMRMRHQFRVAADSKASFDATAVPVWRPSA